MSITVKITVTLNIKRILLHKGKIFNSVLPKLHDFRKLCVIRFSTYLTQDKTEYKVGGNQENESQNCKIVEEQYLTIHEVSY